MASIVMVYIVMAYAIMADVVMALANPVMNTHEGLSAALPIK